LPKSGSSSGASSTRPCKVASSGKPVGASMPQPQPSFRQIPVRRGQYAPEPDRARAARLFGSPRGDRSLELGANARGPAAIQPSPRIRVSPHRSLG
jgi:hypothetical protein